MQRNTLHGFTSNNNISSVASLLVCFIFVALLSHVVVLSATPRFEQVETTYQIERDIVATYFLPVHVGECRGHVEYMFSPYLSGSYVVSYHGIDFFNNSKEDPSVREGSTIQASFSMDLRNVYFESLGGYPKENSEFLTIRFIPQITKNVDPYSYQIYAYYMVSDSFFRRSIQYEALNVTQKEKAWEMRVDMFKIKTEPLFGQQFHFVIYANTNVVVNEQVEIPLRYSRDLQFPNNFGTLTLSYNHISPIPPEQDAPTVTVKHLSQDSSDHILPFNTLLAKYQIEERGHLSTGELMEERSFHFPINNNVDSITCGYKNVGETNINFDKFASIFKDTDIGVFCREMFVDGNYTLYIVGKRIDTRYIETSANYGEVKPFVSYSFYRYDVPLIFDSPRTTDKLRVQHVGGDFGARDSIVINSVEQESLSGVAFPNTTQSNMTMQFAFSVDLTKTTCVLNLIFSNDIKRGVDPSSTRIAILNTQSNSFELLFGDESIPGSMTWSINAKQVSNKFLTYAIFYYDKNVATLDENEYVTYSRTLQYQLDADVTLGLKYEMPTGIFETSSRPYVNLNNRNTIVDYEGNYQIIKNLNHLSGNGLQILNNFDSRIFRVKNRQFITDYNGKQFKPNLSELKCAYLFQETEFTTLEFSQSIPTQDVVNDEFVIECPEDIKDQQYVILLMAGYSQSTPSTSRYNNDIVISSNPMKFDTPNLFVNEVSFNTMTLEFSPYVSYSGTVRFMRLTDKVMKGFQLPYGMILMGGFEIDVSIEKVGSFQGKLFVSFSCKTYPSNVDPRSIVFMKLNSDKTMSMLSDGTPTLDHSIDYYPTIEPKQRIALLYQYINFTAVLGQSYQIRFTRTLEYSIESGVDFYYYIPFSQYEASEYPVFTLTKEIMGPISNYELIYAFKGKEEGFQAVIPTRKFIYSNNHQFYSIEGRLIEDMNSIACAEYYPSSKFVSLIGSPSQHSVGYSQLQWPHSSQSVDGEIIMLVISKKKLPPLPSPSVRPEPSIIPPTPIHSIPVPIPSPVRPEPTIVPPKPEPTIVPPNPIHSIPPKPEPTIIPPKPEPTIEPPTPIHSIPVPKPSPVRPEPTKSQPTPIVTTISNEAVSNKISNGEAQYFVMKVRSDQQVTFSLKSDQQLEMYVGMNFIPSTTNYSYLLISNNDVQFDKLEDGQLFMFIDGPQKGSAMYTLSPQLQTKTSPDNTTTLVVVLSVILLIVFACCLLVGLSGFLYWRKTKTRIEQVEGSEEMYFLETRHDENYKL